MIKSALRFLAKLIANQNWLYKLYMPIVYLNNHVQVIKKEQTAIDLSNKNDAKLIAIVGDPVVKNGFFKGMKYPSFDSVCSTIFPKIIGSYEAELKDTIQQIIQNNYDVIIDVGCAEGYYAVGLAMQTKATVLAYDTDANARKLCLEMATLNSVQDKIQIKETFTIDDIKKLDPNKRTVIICDCEGYEKQLFNSENCKNLKNCDLLIETHDLFDLSISSYLINLFKNTHQNPIIISSIDDNKKVQIYQFPETENLDLITKKIIFAEERKAIMEWLYIEKRAA